MKAFSTRGLERYSVGVEGSVLTESWVVYVLLCGDDSLYCGITKDLERRVAMHGAGRGAKYTRGRSPLKVLHFWKVPTKRAAILEERAFKALSRRGKMAFLSMQSPGAGGADALRGCTDGASGEG